MMKLVNADERGLRDAALVLRNGGVVIYPTETVYGLGCEPSNPDATRRVCEIKGRADKPLPLICADTKSARRVVEFNAAAEKLVERFWPGPLSLVLPSKVDYPIWVTRHKPTLAVRVPGHEAARRLAGLCGGVIVSTSANRSGEEPPRTAQGAIEQIGSKVDVVVDGGITPGGESSTVLDLSSEELWVLRSGPVSSEDILKALRA
jgi:L-threonylcarbamoyladenylate synthase